MDIKSCALLTKLGRIAVESQVFYICKSTPQLIPPFLGGNTMDLEAF